MPLPSSESPSTALWVLLVPPRRPEVDLCLGDEPAWRYSIFPESFQDETGTQGAQVHPLLWSHSFLLQLSDQLADALEQREKTKHPSVSLAPSPQRQLLHLPPCQCQLERYLSLAVSAVGSVSRKVVSQMGEMTAHFCADGNDPIARGCNDAGKGGIW